jgi:PHS family inorganic phosphate transporter-like MFS transporter
MSESVCTTNDADCKEGDQAEWVSGIASATVFVGAIAGQLSMGYLGDIIGRSRALFFTLLLASLGAAGSALFSFGSPTSIYAVIICFRFILGIGAGGVYPLSATKAAEDSSSGGGKVNSLESAKAFFWQAPGAMSPWYRELSMSCTPTYITCNVLSVGWLHIFLRIQTYQWRPSGV